MTKPQEKASLISPDSLDPRTEVPGLYGPIPVKRMERMYQFGAVRVVHFGRGTGLHCVSY